MAIRNSTIVWDHWHIEASSICALRCPRCPRAEVNESLLNRSLTLKFFQTQLGENIVRQIKKITFCGNDGDPIYCREFLEIISWLKEVNSSINLTIITNGSWKSKKWWNTLANLLNENDTIHWSLDGWSQESNEIYRVNSDWNTIMSGIEVFTNTNSSTYRVWATIAFKFNESDLVKMENLASNLGFDNFQITKSTKFGSKYPTQYPRDLLEPSKEWVAKEHRFERVNKLLTKKNDPNLEIKLNLFLKRSQDIIKYNQYPALCSVGNKGVFLNSRGEFFPCCWVANRYEHNQWWLTQAKEKFNLWNRTFEEVIGDSFWSEDFLKYESQECQTKCTHEALAKNNTHATEW